MNLPMSDGRAHERDRILHEFRELDKRWENRLFAKVGAFGKRYLEGRLSIVCYLARTGETSDVKPAPGSYCKSHVFNGIAVAISNRGAMQGGQGDNRNEQSMLVHVVEFEQSPAIQVASLVRLYEVENYACELWKGAHYFSEQFNVLNVVPASVFRELRHSC